jgi:RNase P subunit RPR2
MFMWLLMQRRIQCRTVLLPDTICEVCSAEDETPEHIVFGCVIGAQFWEKIGMPNINGTTVDNLHSLSPPRDISKEEFSAFIALSCWQLYKTRNAAVFRNERHNISQVLAACKAAAEQWRFRFPPRKKRPNGVRCCKVQDRIEHHLTPFLQIHLYAPCKHDL